MSKTKILAILNEKIDLLILNNQTNTEEYKNLLAQHYALAKSN